MQTADVFETIRDVNVLNLDAALLALDSLWQSRRVALVFLRHFG